jgi:hypothetical protein
MTTSTTTGNGGRVTRALRQLVALEPALVRQCIGLVVAGLLIWGLDYTALGDQLEATADVVGALVAVMTQLWARAHTTPAAAVIARVTNPLDSADQAVYVAGGYNLHMPGRRIPPTAGLGHLAGRSGVTELYRDVV